MRRGLRHREETLDDLRQLLQLHRLVELHAVLARDVAQGAGRDIAGQNDDRDLAMKLLPQLRGDLKPVHAVRQIVVREDEVGPDRPSRHQFQRRDAVRRCRRAMAFVLEEKLEELAHFGIVLDDQDRAGAASSLRRPVIACRADGVRVAAPRPLGGSVTSTAKTEPLPGCERTRTRWPSRFPRRCTMERPRPRPRLRSRAALSS